MKSEPLAVLDMDTRSLGCGSQVVGDKAGSIQMPEFIKFAREFDPRGKLRNEFLNTNLFREA